MNDEWERYYPPNTIDSSVYGPDRDGTQWRRNHHNPDVWEYREINSTRWTVYGTIPLADLLAPIPLPPVTVNGETWRHQAVYGVSGKPNLHHSGIWYCDSIEADSVEGEPLYEALTLLALQQSNVG